MAMYREDQLSYFRRRRSMGFAAHELINGGYQTMNNDKMPEFQAKSTKHAKLLDLFRKLRAAESTPSPSDLSALEGIIAGGTDLDFDCSEEMYESVRERTGPEASSWQFHMDGEDLGIDDGDDGSDGPDEGDGNDPDVDVDEWSEENDVLDS
ncbi:hypothetical protein BDZ89DRAFT_1127019 [Hymenopellis radicata]|nr:hypothetical protein BDZ89DRAFT_1127019 [Hymenopellis radicata]